MYVWKASIGDSNAQPLSFHFLKLSEDQSNEAEIGQNYPLRIVRKKD